MGLTDGIGYFRGGGSGGGWAALKDLGPSTMRKIGAQTWRSHVNADTEPEVNVRGHQPLAGLEEAGRDPPLEASTEQGPVHTLISDIRPPNCERINPAV
jgi:hypothetical protein